MGLRYTLFKIYFEIKKRLGVMKLLFPINPQSIQFISFSNWVSNKQPYLFSASADVYFDLNEIGNKILNEQANKILNGKFTFFSSLEFDLGKNYDWITNPETGYQYEINKHWTEINDYSKTSGDIKYVWEKSRFTYLYTLIRDEQHNKSNHAQFVFSEIENWIDKNPMNCGPNYKCSQEISIRVLNWIFGIYYYSDKINIDEKLWQKILNSIFWQIDHVYKNIHFSRIAVRNNHTITETLTLYIVGTLFPFFKDANMWKLRGKKWFEKEIEYQVYEDGTFLQFSMNYHRVVVQLLSLGITIAERNGDKFTSVVYDRAYQSVNFLYQCQEDTNGWLPNYGANDGALFFPLNNSDYRDFRPQLNVLHKILTNQYLYNNNEFNEDCYWFGINNNEFDFKFKTIQKQMGLIEFSKGGYYLIREKESLTFLRCGNHKDRPSQADNLHLDIWVKGENILFDAGSYKYNTDPKTLKYFMGSESHNTVMLDDNDQMLKGARFIWYYWTQKNKALLKEEKDKFIFYGSIKSFQYKNNNIKHIRIVEKEKNKLKWNIKDTIESMPNGSIMTQLWHFNKTCNLNLKSKGTFNSKEGFCSSYYGDKFEINQTEISTKENELNTIIIINY